MEAIAMTTVFISYSWDSESHKERIRRFVEYLRKHRIKVIFDEEAPLGERSLDFMERGIRTSDYVLMCYTPLYKQKADKRLKSNHLSGVAYEHNIITAEIYKKNNQRKFIPVLFEGTWETSTPSWAVSKLGVDLSGDNSAKEIEKLLEALNSRATNNLSEITSVTSTKTKIKKIYVAATVAAAFIASIATIVGVLFGDNIIGGLFTEDNNVTEDASSEGNSNEEGSEDVPSSGGSLDDGIIVDVSSFANSLVEDQADIELDSSFNNLLDKIWEDSNYVTSEYIKNIINTGIRRYNNGEFFYAGALFEQAIKEGDEGVTARNNLSFMIRRHEYESRYYELDDLLDQCIENGGAFASINYAMYLVSIGEWEQADSQFEMIEPSDPEIQECISWWGKLYNRGDCEGGLVLGWLLKYGFYEDKGKSSSDYFRDVKQYYEGIPDFLY